MKLFNFLVAYIILAGLSFFLTLHIQYQGEEGVYTITAIEMWFHKTYFHRTLYGSNFGRPPLLTWITIALTNYLGWDNVLVAIRIIAATATVLTATVAAFFTQYLFRNKLFTALSIATFFTGDILIQHGWRAYADPLFTLFVFTALVCLWVSVKQRSLWFLIPAVISLSAAFMTKALTAYLFYAITAGLLLLYYKENRWFLFNPVSILLHCAALSVPYLWFTYGNPADANTMLFDISRTFDVQHLWHEIFTLVFQPIKDSGKSFAPLTLVALYYLIRRRKKSIPEMSSTIKLIAWITLLNCLPYWLLPRGNELRYLMPVLPFYAMLIAYVIYASGEKALKVASIWLLATLIVKYITCFWFVNYFEAHIRGNYKQVAQGIYTVTKNSNQPIYTINTSATGLSVVSNLDLMRLPAAPITEKANPKNGFVISSEPDGRVYTKYCLGQDAIYLLCYGTACDYIANTVGQRAEHEVCKTTPLF